MKISKTLLAAALSVASVGAFANPTVLGSTFSGASQSTAMGTFSAYTFGDVAGLFGTKGQDGVTGVGVQGGTSGNELDIGQSIVGVFNQGYQLSQFSLGLLFDGPEYKDVQERAQVSVKYTGSNSFTDYVLTAFRSASGTTASWSGAFGSVVNIKPALDGKGGVWSVLNPFGNAKIDEIKFTAIPGISAGGCTGTCDNQTDYTLVSVTAVPELETYAMMLAGLGLMGTIARRRNKSKAV
jgi:hypothetical protein